MCMWIHFCFYVQAQKTVNTVWIRSSRSRVLCLPACRGPVGRPCCGQLITTCISLLEASVHPRQDTMMLIGQRIFLIWSGLLAVQCQRCVSTMIFFEASSVFTSIRHYIIVCTVLCRVIDTLAVLGSSRWSRSELHFVFSHSRVCASYRQQEYCSSFVFHGTYVVCDVMC